MDFIYEKDRSALLFEFLDHAFQARFEVAAELGAGKQRPHIEGIDLDFEKSRRDLLLMDFERKTLRYGGFTHPGVPHEDGVVLAAPAKYLERSQNFLITPDKRIDQTLGGLFDQVYGKALEEAGLAVRLVLGRGKLLKLPFFGVGNLGDAV